MPEIETAADRAIQAAIRRALEQAQDRRDAEDPTATQLTHAETLMARRGDLRHAPGLGWLAWNGVKWVATGDAAIHHAVQEAAKTRRELENNQFSKGLCSRRGIDDVVAIAERLPGVYVEPAQLDRHPDWIHAAGQTWDLRNGDAWNTSTLELNTKALEWEPQAHCPEWLQFLDNCFPGEPEMPAYLQRLVGYGITGHTREQLFVLMHGDGANGKSTFINALTEAFRDYTANIPIEVLMSTTMRNAESPSPMLLQFRGARLVFTAESERGGRLNEPMIKLLTGGDEISARALHRDPVTFRPQALIFMATNHLPDVRGTDNGIWRRVKLIQWKQSFEGRADKGIGERLAKEAPGIISWAMDGALDWYRDGLQQPERVTMDTKEMRESADFFGGFVPEWLEKDSSSWLPRAKIMEIWTEFSDANGNREPLKNSNTLYSGLEERGFESATRKGVRGYRCRRTQ